MKKELCVKLVIYENWTEMHCQQNIKFMIRIFFLKYWHTKNWLQIIKLNDNRQLNLLLETHFIIIALYLCPVFQVRHCRKFTFIHSLHVFTRSLTYSFIHSGVYSNMEVPTRCTCYRVYFYLTIVLHVSSIIITHLQEHKTTVTTASGNRYTVIDRVEFTVKEYL